ncbi:MAG: ribosomal protein L7/L12 [Moraxellaceae bacterium]|nr:ribosomal protein L7/L12 [Moraxellaceae bacterium]
MIQHYSTPLPLSAIGALALGHKIDAIKIVRQENSLSLKEAKEAVEAYERAHPDLHAATTPKPATSESMAKCYRYFYYSGMCYMDFLLLNQS